MTTKMFQASIGQKVTLQIGPETYVTGAVKARFLDGTRRVMLVIVDANGVQHAGFEFYARPYDDTAERREAARLADQHARAEQERQRQAREEAKLFEDAERAMVKQAKEQMEAERRAEQARHAADERAAKLAADAQRSAAKRAAKEQKEAAKRAAKEAKEMEREAAEMRERAVAAEAEERVSRLTFEDPCAGWTMRVSTGETTKRSTATRAAVGTVLTPGLGTVIGLMVKKGSDWVYMQMLNADGAVVSSNRHPAAHSSMLNSRCVRFNKRHMVGADEMTEAQRDARAAELKRQVKLLRKQGS